MGTNPAPADEPTVDVSREGPEPPATPVPGEPPARPAGRLDDSRCSVRARLRGDSPVATAPPARRWLLIEQPGPWGRDALFESRFDAAVAPRLAARARAEHVRVLLVRRPGGRLTASHRRWGYADARPGSAGLWWSTRSADAELLDAPWDGSVGVPASGATYLVCTHGGHDACCALRGRPLARTLPVPRPGDVWECSHLGGDRFSANVLVLPHGFFYGQVPGDGAELVAAHERQQVALPWLRGRAGVPAPGQAAQHSAREALGLLGIDDLPITGIRPLPADGDDTERWTVTMAGPDGEVVATVCSRPSDVAAQLTCHAAHPAHSRTWHVEALGTAWTADRLKLSGPPER